MSILLRSLISVPAVLGSACARSCTQLIAQPSAIATCFNRPASTLGVVRCSKDSGLTMFLTRRLSGPCPLRKAAPNGVSTHNTRFFSTCHLMQGAGASNGQLHMCRALSQTATDNSGGNNGTNSGGPGSGDNWGKFGGSEGDSSPFNTNTAMLFAIGILANLGLSSTAHAKNDSKSSNGEIDQFVNSMMDLAGPILTNLGFSGMVGMACAAALKFVGKTIAVAIGLLFALIQGMAYFGFITVNWTKVHGTVVKALDQDGDGDLDAADFKHMMKNFVGVLSQGVPSVGGFLAGFTLGLKMF